MERIKEQLPPDPELQVTALIPTQLPVQPQLLEAQEQGNHCNLNRVAATQPVSELHRQQDSQM
jgi:hypothetical protein